MSSNDDERGLSDSDPKLSSNGDGDNDGCSSEDELDRSGVGMNVTCNPKGG